jgi:hypothetical protein
MPAISREFFPAKEPAEFSRGSRINLADFGRWPAYLFDSAGRNSVSLAQLLVANEPLIATVAGVRNGCCWFPMVDGQLRLGANSPSKHGRAATVDRKTSAPGRQPIRLGTDDARKRYGSGFALQTASLFVRGTTACHRHSYFFRQKSRVYPGGRFYDHPERSQPPVKHLRQLCRFEGSYCSRWGKCADRFRAEREPFCRSSDVLFHAINVTRRRDAHWDIARVPCFPWMHSDAGRDRSTDLRACQNWYPSASSKLGIAAKTCQR